MGGQSGGTLPSKRDGEAGRGAVPARAERGSEPRPEPPPAHPVPPSFPDLRAGGYPRPAPRDCLWGKEIKAAAGREERAQLRRGRASEARLGLPRNEARSQLSVTAPGVCCPVQKTRREKGCGQLGICPEKEAGWGEWRRGSIGKLWRLEHGLEGLPGAKQALSCRPAA